MRPQAISVDMALMLSTAMMYVGLAAAGWLLLRLVQACFWLPGHLHQKRLREIEEQEKQDLQTEDKDNDPVAGPSTDDNVKPKSKIDKKRE